MIGFGRGTEVLMNRSMRPIYENALGLSVVPKLPSELERVRRRGVVICGDCVLLKAYAGQRFRTAPDRPADEIEFWVNDVGLDSKREPSDPAWRLELLSWAIDLSTDLLSAAVELRPGIRFQALISLQSAPGFADPEIDFATGSVRFSVVRSPERGLSNRDIAADGVGDQPVLYATT